jgi:hypothetical protein
LRGTKPLSRLYASIGLKFPAFPALDARFWYRNADFTMLKRVILGFCGIRMVRTRRIGRVKYLDAALREKLVARLAVCAPLSRNRPIAWARALWKITTRNGKGPK